MPPTEVESSNDIDQALDRLNSRWDLRLPKLPSGQADAAYDSEGVAGKCSNLIRSLCSKTETFHAILCDFEERARQIHSQWVFKPSQEPGTLPVLPVTKSLLARKVGLVPLSDSQRNALLEILHEILNENQELAQLSPWFLVESASTSAASFTTAPITLVSEAVCRGQDCLSTAAPEASKKPWGKKNAQDGSHLKQLIAQSSRRSIGSPFDLSRRPESEFLSAHILPQQNEEQRKPSEIRQFKPISSPRPGTRNLQVPDPISFDTAVSSAVCSVFSTAVEDYEGGVSNDTSLITSQAEGSPDLFPMEDYNELFEDEQFSTSFNELSQALTQSDPTDLRSNGPFTKQAILPLTVPFWYCWEMYRLAPWFGLKPIELYKEFEQIHKKLPASSEEFWLRIKELCRAKALPALPHKSELPSWIVQNNSYTDEKTNRVAHFTAALDWNEDSSRSVLQLRLNAIQLVKSSRFHRKFGADRFIALDGPPFGLPDKLRRLSPKSAPLYDKVIDFLASNSHFIAGRSWRACFVDEVKSKARRNKAQPRRSRIILFAETGFDMVPRPHFNLGAPDVRPEAHHRNIMRQELMQWHMPLNANADSMDLKLFSRWSIGFSRTTPTVELKRHEFLYRPDELGDLPDDGSKRKVMNDGCALMSYPLAKAIWAAYGGEGEPPSAVQGRISGSKGLWLVDYDNMYATVSDRGYWIEVSESQLKIKPHPREREEADDDAILRTFEVLKYAAECKPAHLNIQLINILEDRGVPRSILQEALQSDVQSFSITLTEAMKDPRCLRLWMQDHAPSSRLETKKALGSFPSASKEQIKVLLESGFHPQSCRKLITNAYRLLNDYLTNYMDKMWIQIPHSTAAFCAPDPLGVLAPGEVYLGSSIPITHPVSGLKENTLEGMELLVARNPAHLGSDMQKCTAVYKHELRHYKNVILFSRRGVLPLASLLSGGDYDGDVVTCIWDPEIVRHFCNVDMPPMPNEVECGMVQRSEAISKTFNVECPEDQSFEDYFRKCIAFNARPSLLGSCASEHEKLVYALSQKLEHNKLQHSGAVKLAALAGFLVDSNKQGWDLTEKEWHGVRVSASGPRSLPEPAYKAGIALRKPVAHANVIDYLRFDVAEKLKEQVLQEFTALEKDTKVLNYDRDLSQRWLYWWSAIEEDKAEKRRAGRSQIKQDTSHTAGSSRQPIKAPSAAHLDILTDLLEGEQGLLPQIQAIEAQWSRLVPRFGIEPTPNDTKDWGEYSLAVATVYEKFRAIQPKRLDHELGRRYEEEKDRPISEWALLRASCLHRVVCSKGKSPSWVWYIAGRELCYLKALQHTGDVRMVISEIHDLYKVDTKYARALMEGCPDEGGDQENAVDEENLSDDDVDLEID
ncbi:hypothetical protein AYL99_05148 [Fonsecaea erecta]|uniref:RNA-dependent RNA polymerase n=1 Tax=Fonsecaea erecta TaxID=1367422 RepID=A0A178ZL60_9EURO|nr:hypothetical protein AYL99_05148 [Fonsecaea erecta]OAP60146.1 hypothetical protein AYL99_05148 [Fonsecaea erecta]